MRGLADPGRETGLGLGGIVKKMTTIVALITILGVPPTVRSQEVGSSETRVLVESDGWQLVGDLRVPASSTPVPGVLMLNKADGDRTSYVDLARELAERGIASLRLDLRGHGESTNLGRFVPYERQRNPLIWDSEADVAAAHRYLMSHPKIEAGRIAVVGGSYSGEEMAEAGRTYQYADAYVSLSPGSFSDESISGIDESGVPWLFIITKEEPNLLEITASVQSESRTVELLIAPGREHATRILDARDDMAERIAVWIAYQLR